MPVCRHYARGYCAAGASCRFTHPCARIFDACIKGADIHAQLVAPNCSNACDHSCAQAWSAHRRNLPCKRKHRHGRRRGYGQNGHGQNRQEKRGAPDPGPTCESAQESAQESALEFKERGPGVFDPEAIDPEAFDPEAFDPEAFDPEAFDPKAVDPEAFDPEAVDLEAAKDEVVEPDARLGEPAGGASVGASDARSDAWSDACMSGTPEVSLAHAADMLWCTCV